MSPEDKRAEEFANVAEWIEEVHGAKVAHDWAWTCTPYPCGIPNQSQLDEGLALAVGDVTIDFLMAKSDREMKEAMAEYNASQKDD